MLCVAAPECLTPGKNKRPIGSFASHCLSLTVMYLCILASYLLCLAQISLFYGNDWHVLAYGSC